MKTGTAIGAALRLAVVAAFPTALCAHRAAGQVLGRAPDDGISMWRVIASLLLCLGLAVAAAFALRARSGLALPLLQWSGPRKRRLQLVETLRLGPKIAVSIVRFDGRELLVLSAENHAQVLDTTLKPVGTREPGS